MYQILELTNSKQVIVVTRIAEACLLVNVVVVIAIVTMTKEITLICKASSERDSVVSLSPSSHSSHYSMASLLSDDADSLLNEKLKDWALNHGCSRQCVNDVLGIFIDLGYSVPRLSNFVKNTEM